MLEQFQRFGKDLFEHGLTSSHGGNMSVRMGDRIVITRTGSMLGHLEEKDLIESGLEANDSGIMLASTELIVHRTIYQNTSALAVIHCHPPHAVALSLVEEDSIIPVDNEGSYFIKRIPIVQAEFTAGSQEMARAVTQKLREYKIVMLRGHGCFSTGPMLEEAFEWCSVLEESSKVIYYTRNLQMINASLVNQETSSRIEYRKHSEDYKTW